MAFSRLETLVIYGQSGLYLSLKVVLRPRVGQNSHRANFTMGLNRKHSMLLYKVINIILEVSLD